tara:strand:- start:545 stop:889 length:345 start_codon:yes stop_codon:yes gene_type:complete
MVKVMDNIGTRAKVWHGTAKKTSGGLLKSDLMKNKNGRIISKKKYLAGKKAIKYLVAAGYKTEKGKFGTKKSSKKRPTDASPKKSPAKTKKSIACRVATKASNLAAKAVKKACK